MPFAKDNHVVDAFPPDRPNQPLRLSVLPRRPRGYRPISDAHGANTPNKWLTIGSVAVTDEITGSLVPSAGLSELPGDPFRGWMRGGPQPHKPAPIMPQDQQTIQQTIEKPERNRRHHEQGHRGDAIRMVMRHGLSVRVRHYERLAKLADRSRDGSRQDGTAMSRRPRPHPTSKPRGSGRSAAAKLGDTVLTTQWSGSRNAQI